MKYSIPIYKELLEYTFFELAGFEKVYLYFNVYLVEFGLFDKDFRFICWIPLWKIRRNAKSVRKFVDFCREIIIKKDVVKSKYGYTPAQRRALEETR